MHSLATARITTPLYFHGEFLCVRDSSPRGFHLEHYQGKFALSAAEELAILEDELRMSIADIEAKSSASGTEPANVLCMSAMCDAYNEQLGYVARILRESRREYQRGRDSLAHLECDAIADEVLG